MKALQISAPGEVKVIDLPMPSVGNQEVLLKMRYVGFCGSDLNTFRGMNAMAKPHVIPGHEVSATVVSTGAEVPDFIKQGMSVTVNPYTNCGICPSCRNRRPNACRDNQTLGVQRDGAMREYMVLPWTKIIPTEGLTLEEMALIEPMSVGFHAVGRAEVTDNDTVMVIGCGMVGMGAVVRAAQRGAIVIAADVDDDKLALAKQMGAAYTVNTLSPDYHGQLMSVTGGNGPDVVIEAVGSPVTYRLAVDEVAFTGRVICIGYSKSEVSFATRLFVQKELDIRGSRNALPTDFEAVIRFLKANPGKVDGMISRIVTFDTAQEALEAWNAAPGKVFRILLKMDE